MMEFPQFFSMVTGHEHPHPWQHELAAATTCSNRLIRIPTGMGKTHGVIAAWLWNRHVRKDSIWPRRLVWCLPMRVLVEQVVHEVRECLDRLDILWDGNGKHDGRIGIHLLMGGSDSGDWHLFPEAEAVLVGTQDMLLSRALNRGYAAPRGRWPMEFGLLNQDCLWIMDEVQLMDVGLATSGQLQAFRDQDRATGRSLRPCHTWWMSATMQPGWLATSPETAPMADSLPATGIPPRDRTGPLWDPDKVRKPCVVRPDITAKELPALVKDEHLAGGRGAHGPTLVVLNRVETAKELHRKLSKDKELRTTDIRLVHSRFRPCDRRDWREEFLDRSCCGPGTDRIVIATQLVEAGVDLSAAVLVTEMAPWPSLVQRFGRCARWGGTGRIVVVDIPAAMAEEAAQKEKKKKTPKDLREVRETAEAKAVLPYDLDAVRAARRALELLPTGPDGGDRDAAPLSLEVFEETHPELLESLYPYEPLHILLRHELDELFDTTADLSGADIDISRFIRSGDERDLHVFWARIPAGEGPDSGLRPRRDELCAVPFLQARKWLFGKKATNDEQTGKKGRAWVWDWLDGAWRPAEERDLYPGRTVLVAASVGGYDPRIGWDPKVKEEVPVAPETVPPPPGSGDDAQDDETSSRAAWQTIATHGRLVAAEAADLCRRLAPAFGQLFLLAGLIHDAGKVFPAFQESIKDRPEGRSDLAKAPRDKWLPPSAMYPMPGGGRRAGFRHELLSVLFLFDVLRRSSPDHEALLGPWHELFEKLGREKPSAPAPSRPSSLERRILALDKASFDLLAYLVCAHHGKLRLALHASPADQEASSGRPRLRGLEDGEETPGVQLCGPDGDLAWLPPLRVDLGLAEAGVNPRTGPGWTERVLDLLDRHGPFALAWLEALLRAADQRVSGRAVSDAILEEEQPHG